MSFLDEALSYARRGWQVFPVHTAQAGRCSCRKGDCASGGKHPRIAGGVNRATDDQAVIREWFRRWPDANIGVATGARSGLVVLDVDPRHGGEESLAQLEEEQGGLPVTLFARTGGGGLHLLFIHPGVAMPNSAGRVGEGLDVRGDGGYIVAPPSVHASGEAYRWDNDAPVAALPDWLLRLALKPEPQPTAAGRGHAANFTGAGLGAYERRAMREELARVKNATNGSRNVSLNRATFSLGQLVGGGVLPEPDVIEGLSDAARGAGLTESETRATIKSGLEAGKRQPRTKPARGAARPPAALADGQQRVEAEENGQAIEARRSVTRRVGNYTFTVNDEGTWAADEEGNKTFVTSPLSIEADTRNADNEDWGRLLRFPDREGVIHTWAMPLDLLSGDGHEYRKALFSMGLQPVITRKQRELLALYLNSKPDKTVLCVDKVGWHRGAYVFPDETVGTDDGERFYLQSRIGANRKMRVSGTAEEWRQEIGLLCVNNSRLAFAVSVAFAAPLLDVLGVESGGFHLKGTTSKGKSTVQMVAGSVWGAGGLKGGYAESWDATSTGLEITAQLHNDGLLLLDEMGQSSPEVASNVAYKLAQGQSKIRGHSEITQRRTLQWRLLFLSSGEVSLDEHLRKAGLRAHGGQEVRIVNVEAALDDNLGVFEDLHDFNRPEAFADYLTNASRRIYGAPIRAYLRLITPQLPLVKQQARESMRRFIAHNVPVKAAGEVQRVANRFALAAFGGELATRRGITGWEEGEATKAAGTLFREWLTGRGTIGNSDEEAAIRQVRAFIEAHGASRFQSMSGDNERINNRAGYKASQGGEVTYYIFPEVFRSEVCRGFDAQLVIKAMDNRRLLLRERADTYTYRLKTPEGRFPFYALNTKILSEK